MVVHFPIGPPAQSCSSAVHEFAVSIVQQRARGMAEVWQV